jgi:hypothetical protein
MTSIGITDSAGVLTVQAVIIDQSARDLAASVASVVGSVAVATDNGIVINNPSVVTSVVTDVETIVILTRIFYKKRGIYGAVGED